MYIDDLMQSCMSEEQLHRMSGGGQFGRRSYSRELLNGTNDGNGPFMLTLLCDEQVHRNFRSHVLLEVLSR